MHAWNYSQRGRPVSDQLLLIDQLKLYFSSAQLRERERELLTQERHSMEAVWKLEDKWKLSTKQALFFLLFAASGVAAICVVAKIALLRRLRSRKCNEHEDEDEKRKRKWGSGSCGWGGIKTALMGSVRWSGPSKWAGPGPTTGRETPLPLLEKRVPSWPSRSSDSPVWQRPILMGEKCELPRFSGLILYDENGHLLCDVSPTHQEKSMAKAVRTTLRDLL